MNKSIHRGARVAGLCAAALLAFGATPASAKILTATFTGTVVLEVQGGDIFGLFGAPGADLVGQSIVATYRIDDSKGVSSYTPPLSSVIYGGPVFGTQSPITTTITIGGKTHQIAGTYDSQVNQSGPASGFPSVGYSADDRTLTKDGYTDLVAYNFLNNVLTSSDYHVVPTSVTGPNFSYGFVDEDVFVGGVWTNAASIEWLPDSFTFSVSDGVPEISTWAMLILGFAAAGACLRLARKTAAPAI